MGSGAQAAVMGEQDFEVANNLVSMCEVVHTLSTRKAPMNLAGLIDPGGRCHAYERDLSCCDHIGDCAYHGLVNLYVAQGQGRYGVSPNAGFEQFNAALGRVARQRLSQIRDWSRCDQKQLGDHAG